GYRRGVEDVSVAPKVSSTQSPRVDTMAQLRLGAGQQAADLLLPIDLLHLGSGRRRLNEWPWSVLGADEAGDGIGGFGEFFFGCWPIGLSCTDDAVAHMVIE